MSTPKQEHEDSRFERNKGLNIFQRLHAAMEEISYVQKTHTIAFKNDGSGGKGYKVVTHDAVTAKVRPLLVKHGVVYVPQNMVIDQDGNRTAVRMDVTFINIDKPDDRIAVPTIGYGIDTGDKGPGKAVSYAVKYALLKALGLETGEDADLDADVEHKRGEIKVITAEQTRELSDLIQATGADLKRFIDFMRVTELGNIPAAQFAQAKHALEQKKQRKAA